MGRLELDINKTSQERTTELWLFLSLLGVSLEPVLVKFYAPVISALGLVVLKSIVGGFLMIPLYGKLIKLPRSELSSIIQISILAFITNGLIFLALETLPATILITIITITPLLVGVINHIEGRVVVTIKFLIAFALVFVGIIMTIDVYSYDSYKLSQLGLLFASISIFTSAFYRVKMEILTRVIDPLSVSTALFAFNGLFSLIFLPFTSFHIEVVPLVLWLGGAGVIANIAFLYAIKHLGSTRVSILSIIQRPIAVIFGAILLNEAITKAQIIGMCLIFGGIYFAKTKKVTSSTVSNILKK